MSYYEQLNQLSQEAALRGWGFFIDGFGSDGETADRDAAPYWIVRCFDHRPGFNPSLPEHSWSPELRSRPWPAPADHCWDALALCMVVGTLAQAYKL